jgi:hypothetical protein
MLNKALIGSCLALAMAACATAPPATLTASKRPPAGCVSDSASRLPPRGDCAGFGTTYLQKDIYSTGNQQDPAAALRMLSPSIHP